MKPVKPSLGAGIEALEQKRQLLEERKFVASANVQQQYDRDLGPKPRGSGLEREQYDAMVRSRDEAIRNLENVISESQSLLAPLKGLIRMLEGLPAIEGGGPIELEVQSRATALAGVGAVKKMLAAVGPVLAGQFPAEQLGLIEKSLSQELAELERRLPPKASE